MQPVAITFNSLIYGCYIDYLYSNDTLFTSKVYYLQKRTVRQLDISSQNCLWKG